jgi:hypothetical protein
MTQREAKIKALEVVGGFSDCIIEDINLSIYSDRDATKIISAIDSICNRLAARARIMINREVE